MKSSEKNFWRSSQQKKVGRLKDEFHNVQYKPFFDLQWSVGSNTCEKVDRCTKNFKNLWMKMFDQPFRNIDYSMNIMKFDQIAWKSKKTKTVKRISVIETFLIEILISNIIYDKFIGVWWKIEVIISKCKREKMKRRFVGLDNLSDALTF